MEPSILFNNILPEGAGCSFYQLSLFYKIIYQSKMKSSLKITIFLCLLYFTMEAGFQCNVADCQFCSFPNVCGVCQSNFILNLNTSSGSFICTSVTCPSNCQVCYKNNVCQTCNSNFVITMNGTCVSGQSSNTTLPQNCIFGSGSQNCSLCSYGYSLQAGFCYRIISLTYNDPNCKIKMTPEICQICINSNYLVNQFGKCVQNTLNQTNCNILNCLYCIGSNSTCGICSPGYQLTQSNTCTQNTCNMPGCISCSGTNQCSACTSGYVLISNKTCQLVGYGIYANIFCTAYSSAQSCAQCFPGQLLTPYQVGSITTYLCRQIACPYNVTNCNGCTYQFNSLFNYNRLLCGANQCASGYANVNGYCVVVLEQYNTLSTCAVQNCTSCSYPQFCSLCVYGFSVTSGGSCQPTICNVANCVSCSLNNICQSCSNGFQLASGMIPLLQAADSDLQTWAAYLIQSQCILQPNVPCNVNNCAYCLQSNICASCVQGYDFPSAGANTCVAFCTISNCNTCLQSNQNLCQTCSPGYQIQANGQSCQFINFQCSATCTYDCQYNWATNQGQCQQCTSGSILYNYQCYSQTCNISGCSICANWQNPVVCLQCNQGLILAYGYCITPNCNSSVANCQNCIDNGKCVACKSGYYLQNATGTITCVQASSISNCLVANCLACQSGNNMFCQTCASPYIQQNGVCVCNFQNCLDCRTSALACDSCPQPLFATLQVPGCTPEPSLKHTCNVANCQMCFGSGLCSVCAIGYQVSAVSPTNFTCLLNSCASLSNCQLCDAFGYECFLCQSGFMIDNFLQGGACLPINANYTCNISGCAVCNNTNNSECVKCLQTYTMTSPTQCTANGCSMANCYLCLQNNLCTVCDSGYYLANDLSCQAFYSNITNCGGQIAYCNICVINLVNSNNTIYCIKCQDGFQYDSVNSVCTPQTNSIPNCKVQILGAFGSNSLPYCLLCMQSYYPNSWGLCSAYNNPNANYTGCTVYNCLYCAVNSLTCSFCFSPWGISATGQCQTNDSGLCAPNCNYCANSSFCYTCVTGYSQFNSICVQCNVNFCQTCQTTNNCSTCISSTYTLLNNNCLPCNISNCQSCTGVNVCGNCVNGTVLSHLGSACLMCNLLSLTGCISCSSDNICGVCQTQYQLLNGVCITCNVPNCASCSSNNTCATCASTYLLSGGNCIQCLYPCAMCSASNVCSECSTPFYFATPLANGTCVANTIPNCLNYTASNTSSCSACIELYSLANNVCTSNCPPNCLVCFDPNFCIACNVGFAVSSNLLCTQCQVSGCQNCSSNPSTCTACFGNFYLLNNQCKSCPGFCSSCLNSTLCLALVTTSQNVLVTVSPGQTALALCQQNCRTCSSANPQICLECADGFYMTSSRTCQQCSSNCQTCTNQNPPQCVTCFPNSILSGTSCLVCSSNCLTCLDANNLSKCTSCSPGSFLSNQACVSGCPQDCLSCSGATTCTQCVSGYTLFTQSDSLICVTCVSSCRTCAEGSPSSCLSCGAGFYLSGTTCVQCAINCLYCQATGCILCVSGYFLNSAQTCSQNCIFPCATCLSSNPAKCTSCIAGYSYNSLSNTCGPQLACNGGCVACPFGYALSNGTCIPCSASNCQTCAVAATNQCTSCIIGFFLNPSNNQCQACSSSCATCLTGSGCMTCAMGFTTLQNASPSPSGYQCMACNSPCATCINSPNYCTSCVSGFQFQGWKCSQLFNFGFQLTLLTNLTTFNTNYFAFITALANAVSNSNVNSITITSITSGSVSIDGQLAPTASPGSKTAKQQLISLDGTLSKNNNIAGMTIGDSSYVVNGGSADYNEVNLALILGICIPIGFLLVAGIVLYIYCKKKKSSSVLEQKIKEDSGFTVRQSFELTENHKEQSSRPLERNNTGIN